jgi:hypothetical protein
VEIGSPVSEHSDRGGLPLEDEARTEESGDDDRGDRSSGRFEGV